MQHVTTEEGVEGRLVTSSESTEGMYRQAISATAGFGLRRRTVRNVWSQDGDIDQKLGYHLERSSNSWWIPYFFSPVDANQSTQFDEIISFNSWNQLFRMWNHHFQWVKSPFSMGWISLFGSLNPPTPPWGTSPAPLRQCPRLGPDLRHPACSKLTFLDCEASVSWCFFFVGLMWSGEVKFLLGRFSGLLLLLFVYIYI